MRRGKHTFLPENKEGIHTCCILFFVHILMTLPFMVNGNFQKLTRNEERLLVNNRDKFMQI